MDREQLMRFKSALEAMGDALSGEDALGQDAQKTVQLDQTSVGRLSRMDAMQQQAMARATQGRRDVVRQRIAAALARIEAGDYGECSDCGEAIPLKRLELNPTVSLCVGCASR